MGYVQGCLTSLGQRPTEKKALSPLSRTAGSSNSRTVPSLVPSWFSRWLQTGVSDPQVIKAAGFSLPPLSMLCSVPAGGKDVAFAASWTKVLLLLPRLV